MDPLGGSMGPLLSHVAKLVIYEMPKVRNVVYMRFGVPAYKPNGHQPTQAMQNLSSRMGHRRGDGS